MPLAGDHAVHLTVQTIAGRAHRVDGVDLRVSPRSTPSVVELQRVEALHAIRTRVPGLATGAAGLAGAAVAAGAGAQTMASAPGANTRLTALPIEKS
jgi:hypothetical protein